MGKRSAWVLALFCGVVVSGVKAEPSGAGKQGCDDLAKLTLPQTQIIQSSLVAAGALASEHGFENPVFSKLPTFCRLIAVSRPSGDSNIKIEVWLPLSGWNGKFMGQGNGGFAGSIGRVP